MFVNHSFLLSVHQTKSLHTIFYQLIATATIAFNKTNYAATKRGRLRYECGYYTRVATKPLWGTQAASMQYCTATLFVPPYGSLCTTTYNE